MIRDITLGQYFPGDSLIHKLDARVKIIGTFVYVIALFIVKDMIGFAISAGALALVIGISRVPIRFILRGLKPIFIIILITFVLNMLMSGGEPLVKWWIITITREGLYNAFFLVIRLMLLILGSSLLTLTTKPINLTDGLESLLGPLRVFKVPAHDLAMMMGIALRFIPTLLEETDKIMKAQMARGADFESGSLLRRAKNLVPILVPLFISAFRIAQDLAMAMEARCYRGGNSRTRLHEMKIGKRDVAAMIVFVVFLSIIIIGPMYW